MTPDERLEAFCAFFKKLDKSCTEELYEFYTPDVLFIDPLHRIEGAKALERYFSTLYENVTACRFRFHDRQASGRQAFVTWTLQLVHPRLDGGREIEGCSQLTFAEDDRVARHRDYFDAAALLYERLPLPLDVSDRAAVARAGEGLAEAFGGLDLALLNAGTCEYLEAGRFDVDLVERVFAPNFLGAVYCIDAALPLLRRARAEGGRPPRRPYRHRGRGARRPPLRHRYRLHRLQRLDLPPLPAPAGAARGADPAHRDELLGARNGPGLRVQRPYPGEPLRPAPQPAAAKLLSPAARHPALQPRGHPSPGERRPGPGHDPGGVARGQRLRRGLPAPLPAAHGSRHLVRQPPGAARLPAAVLRALLPQPRPAVGE